MRAHGRMGARAVADDVHAWLTGFSRHEAGTQGQELGRPQRHLPRWRGRRQGPPALRAALHRFDVDLLGKLVPEIVSGGADLWVSCARLVSLEVAINLFKYPSLKETVLPKVLKFVIAILGRAHSSGDEATALELSRYLKMLRSFSRVRSPGAGGARRRVEAEPKKVTEEGQQPGCGKFEILRTGLGRGQGLGGHVSALSSGLNNPALPPQCTATSRCQKGINSYIVRLVQEAPIDEIGHSLGRLGLSPTRTLLDVFWSALTPGVRSRALVLLDALGAPRTSKRRPGGFLGSVEPTRALQRPPRPPAPAPAPRPWCGTCAAWMRVIGLGWETSPPHLDVHIGLGGDVQVRGRPRRAWPKRMVREDADDDGDGDGEEGDGEADGDGLDSIPALWFAEMEEESVRRIIVEGARLRGDRPVGRVVRVLGVMLQVRMSTLD